MDNQTVATIIADTPQLQLQERLASKEAVSCEDLKGSVYDVTAGKDKFLKTTRKIAEYVGRGRIQRRR